MKIKGLSIIGTVCLATLVSGCEVIMPETQAAAPAAYVPPTTQAADMAALAERVRARQLARDDNGGSAGWTQ